MSTKVDEQRADALAALEEGHSLNAGSLLPETFLRKVATAKLAEENRRESCLTVFSKLISLKRRDAGLSLEELARQADIEVLELLSIETDLDEAPEPRSVSRLARALHLPPGKLMQLAGHAAVLDATVAGAACRFATDSDSMQKLTKTEKDALSEFVRALSVD